MDSKEIVRRLVVGSDVIDRMKREIDSVVSAVLGLVFKKHEVKSWHGEFSKKFEIETLWSPDFPGCKWYFVKYFIGNDDKITPGKTCFEAECCLNIGFGEARFERKYGKFDIPHRHVQQIYESLPLFIDGMRKLFPFLEDYWQPFIDAADYSNNDTKAVPANDRETGALMQIISSIVRRHERGLVSLDEPTFELFELAKRVCWAENEQQLQSVLTDIANFKK